MDTIPNWETLNEAKQEAMKEGNRSVGTRNTRAYEREYGPFANEEAYLKSVGEILEGDIF